MVNCLILSRGMVNWSGPVAQMIHWSSLIRWDGKLVQSNLTNLLLRWVWINVLTVAYEKSRVQSFGAVLLPPANPNFPHFLRKRNHSEIMRGCFYCFLRNYLRQILAVSWMKGGLFILSTGPSNQNVAYWTSSPPTITGKVMWLKLDGP